MIKLSNFLCFLFRFWYFLRLVDFRAVFVFVLKFDIDLFSFSLFFCCLPFLRMLLLRVAAVEGKGEETFSLQIWGPTFDDCFQSNLQIKEMQKMAKPFCYNKYSGNTGYERIWGIPENRSQPFSGFWSNSFLKTHASARIYGSGWQKLGIFDTMKNFFEHLVLVFGFLFLNSTSKLIPNVENSNENDFRVAQSCLKTFMFLVSRFHLLFLS